MSLLRGSGLLCAIGKRQGMASASRVASSIRSFSETPKELINEHYERPEIAGVYRLDKETIDSYRNVGQDFPTHILGSEEELAPEEPSVMAFWGTAPIAVSLGIVAVSKELYLFNDESIVVAATATCLLGYYIQFGGMIKTQAALWAQSNHDFRWEKMLREKSELQKVIDARNSVLGLSSVTEKFFAYKDNLRERLFAARSAEQQKVATDAVLQQLSAQAAKEAAGADVEKKAIAENATQYALNSFKGNARTKEQVILDGLAAMETGASQKDAIGGLFQEYLTKYDKEQAPRLAAEAKEAAKKNVSKAQWKKLYDDERAAQRAVYKPGFVPASLQ